MNTNNELFPHQTIVEEIPNPQIKTVEQLSFDKLSIPPYQRPYKWTAKNTNQLITDLLAFRNKNRYRLGTLVLHNNEIVDGQQRIVTLTLLITKMYEWIEEEKRKQLYMKFVNSVEAFSSKTKFNNRHSLHNVVENIHVIETRKKELDSELMDFLLKKCEFVVIELGDISEAFQFFDSQNARGKDLAAHDLLKAYHLREIEDMSADDSRNIDQWQTWPTDKLCEIFLTMFRAKRWSLGKSARYFTKDEVGTFKGVSLKNGKRYPFYRMEIIAHIFSQIYNNDPLRAVDQHPLEYPFNLDDQIVNGSRFFDMVCHYMSLYLHVIEPKTFDNCPMAKEIIDTINDYEAMWRTGDQYVRSLFNAILFYYIDRFGDEELDKVVPKFFIWSFTLRLTSPAVQLASVDNWAMENDSLFRKVHDATTPYDIINISQESISKREVKSTKCEQLEQIFKELNKIYYE